jgi:hypothetical protein
MADGGHEPGFLPRQRSEALSDGIFAVAGHLQLRRSAPAGPIAAR